VVSASTRKVINTHCILTVYNVYTTACVCVCVCVCVCASACACACVCASVCVCVCVQHFKLNFVTIHSFHCVGESVVYLPC